MKYKKSKISKIEEVDYDNYVYDIMLENQAVPYFYANDILTHNSAYPHAIMQGNLCSPIEGDDGWDGDNYYTIDKVYDNKNMGKVECALTKIYNERAKAKKVGDKIKEIAYKLILNSYYGTLGNTVFKNTYNPYSAANCTSIVRTWMKKLAKTLEESGFTVLYGFTDSVMVEVPDYLNKEILMHIVNDFIDETKKHLPFPQDTFQLEIDKEMKFIWFVAKNCYLWVDTEDKVGYRSTLLDKNTPDIIMKLFNEYMSPKIVSEMDVNFTEKELKDKLKEMLVDNINLAGQTHTVKAPESYASKTSIQYQIAKVYGEGKHTLIPNKKKIGVGKSKGTKKKVGVRYCTLEQYKENKLRLIDIDFEKMIKYLKPFFKKPKSI